METQTKVFTAHIPLALAKEVDTLSERLERSRAWILKQALSEWVAQEKEYYQMTLEALEDVKTSKTVEHSQVQTWVDSLGSKKPLPMPKCD